MVVVLLSSSSSSYSSPLHWRCVRAVLCPAGKPRRGHGEGCPGQALSWQDPCHVGSGELPSGTGGSRLSQDHAGVCDGHLPAAPCRLEIPAGGEPQSGGLCQLPQGLLGDTQLLPAPTLRAVAGHLAPPPMAQTSPVPAPHSPQAPSCPCSALVTPGCGISGLLVLVFFPISSQTTIVFDTGTGNTFKCAETAFLTNGQIARKPGGTFPPRPPAPLSMGQWPCGGQTFILLLPCSCPSLLALPRAWTPPSWPPPAVVTVLSPSLAPPELQASCQPARSQLPAPNWRQPWVDWDSEGPPLRVPAGPHSTSPSSPLHLQALPF